MSAGAKQRVQEEARDHMYGVGVGNDDDSDLGPSNDEELPILLGFGSKLECDTCLSAFQRKLEQEAI